MKYFYLSILSILLFFSEHSTAQSAPWGQVGDTWIYEVIAWGEAGFRVYEVEKDTAINGYPSKKINSRYVPFYGIPPSASTMGTATVAAPLFFSVSNDSIFWYSNGSFEFLYAFNAAIGDSWEIPQNADNACGGNVIYASADTLEVLQTGMDTILSGQAVATLTLENKGYWTLGGKLYAGIGPHRDLVPVADSCNVIDGMVGTPWRLLCFHRAGQTYQFGSSSFGACSILLSDEEAFQVEQAGYFFPNPAKNQLYFSEELQGDFHVRIYDTLGRLIRSENWNPTIDLAELQAGWYVLTLHNASGECMHRQRIQKH